MPKAPASTQAQVRLRQHLELFDQQGEDATIQAIFTAMRRAAFHCTLDNYLLDLTNWSEPLRAEIDHALRAMLLLRELHPHLLFVEVHTLLVAILNKYLSMIFRTKLIRLQQVCSSTFAEAGD